MASLDIFRRTPGLDLTWSDICRKTLLFDPHHASILGTENFHHSSQFFLGEISNTARSIVTY
jgi:hypothetical protein